MTSPIRTPFFEIGPKTFLDRDALLEVADAADAASRDDNVAVIITPPALDLEAVKRAAPSLWVFAQSMDVARRGPSTGAIVADALAAVGADGVLLNHVERPLDERALPAAIEHAHESALLTLVCANDVTEAVRYAAWGPTMILLEPAELIGTAFHGERPWIEEANEAVASVDPAVQVMHSGGVANEQDVRMIMGCGAAGTGCTSAIMLADNRRDMTRRMIRAVREGWEARNTALESTTAGQHGEQAR